MKQFIFLLIFFASNFSNAQGIEFFHGSWEEALVEAKKNDRLIFVDAFAKWCGPCKKMAASSFKDDELGKFHKDNFISLKIDMEESMGRKFGKTYRVTAYPTLFYIDADGEVVKKVTGFRKAEQLVSLGNEAIKSVDKSGDYELEYNKGNRDYGLVYNYVKELNKVGKPSLKISNEYLNSKPEITDEQKAEFLYAAVVDADSKIFDQMILEKSTLEKIYGKDEVKEKVRLACINTVNKAIEYEYPELKEESIKQFKKAYSKDSELFGLQANMIFAAAFHRFDEWKALNKKYLKKYGKKDPSLYLESITILKTKLQKHSEAKSLVLEYAEKLIKIDDSTQNYYEYIGALLENKDNSKALEITNEAIKKAQSKDENIKQLERYLQYIQAL